MKKEGYTMNDLSELLRKLNNTNIKNTPQKNQVENLLSSLNKSDADKVRSILNDPVKTKQVLNTPEAQALIKKLSGGK